MRIISLATIFILLTISCTSQKNSVDLKMSISNAEYKIKYPETWRVDSSGQMGTELIFYSPLDGDDDKFSENVNFLIQDLKGRNIDLNKYKEITDGELADLKGDSKVIESKIISKNNTSLYRLSYEMTQDGRQLKFISICYIKGEKAYLLTFTSIVSTFARFEASGEAILNSFELTK